MAEDQPAPHLPQFLLELLQAPDAHQLEDQAVDVPLNLPKNLISAASPGLSPRGGFSDHPARLALGTSSPRPALRPPSRGLDRLGSAIACGILGTAARAADEAQLAAEVAHEGATDRTLVPRLPPC